MITAFTLEEKAFLSKFNVEKKEDLISILRKLEVEDDFTREFIEDIIIKIERK